MTILNTFVSINMLQKCIVFEIIGFSIKIWGFLKPLYFLYFVKKNSKNFLFMSILQKKLIFRPKKIEKHFFGGSEPSKRSIAKICNDKNEIC